MSSILALSNICKHSLYHKETDIRKSFDSLCGIINNGLVKCVLEGDTFIFINKLRMHLELKLRERGRFALFYCWLEQCTFEMPAFDIDACSKQLRAYELMFMSKGISLKEIGHRKTYQQIEAKEGALCLLPQLTL